MKVGETVLDDLTFLCAVFFTLHRTTASVASISGFTVLDRGKKNLYTIGSVEPKITTIGEGSDRIEIAFPVSWRHEQATFGHFELHEVSNPDLSRRQTI